MDRAQLELLVAVADEGTLTGAARRLRTAQPALTRRLSALERQLGVALFERGRHGTVATPAGRSVVAEARTALLALERADRAAARVAAGLEGSLRIGTTPTLGADLLPRVLAEFRDLHPEVGIELVASGNSSLLHEQVADGSLDVAIAVTPAPRDPRLSIAAAGPQEFALVLPTDDPAAALASVPRRLLGERPLVALPRGEGLRIVLERVLTDARVRGDVAIETPEREMLLPLVAAGLGVALVPEAFARQRTAAGVEVRPLDPPVRREVGAIVRTGADDPLVRSLSDLVGEALATPA